MIPTSFCSNSSSSTENIANNTISTVATVHMVFQSIGMFRSCLNQQLDRGCLSEPASSISSRLTTKRKQQLNKCWPNICNIPIHGRQVYCKWTYKWQMFVMFTNGKMTTRVDPTWHPTKLFSGAGNREPISDRSKTRLFWSPVVLGAGNGLSTLRQATTRLFWFLSKISKISWEGALPFVFERPTQLVSEDEAYDTSGNNPVRKWSETQCRQWKK